MIKKDVIITDEFLVALKKRINESDDLTTEYIAEKIAKDENFVKQVLRGDIREVLIQDVVNLITTIYDVSDQEALQTVEKMITGKSGEGKVLTYDELDKIATIEGVQKIIDNIDKGFMEFYKFNPKLAFIKLNDINANMHFDLGLVISLMSLNYEKLALCPVEKRKELIDTVNALIDKFSKER
ncbi:MAG: hypothetical protein RR048_02100 [Oscillospiraceae bacterium]